MNAFAHVPPGFRFHPTDEELVDYYLRRKINSRRIDLDVIKDIDLYKIEPWDLQELCRLGTDDQNEWYFFSHKDKKYPTGTRTNRATTAGFWKATGRDKAIYSKHDLVGMRKTLVFYRGRAPNGQKSDWIMHEYRLETDENGTSQEEGWVVCRVFKKRPVATMRRIGDHDSPLPYWYDDHQVSFMPSDSHDDSVSPKQQPLQSNSIPLNYHPIPYHSNQLKKELDHFPYQIPQDQNPNLQLFQNPRFLQPLAGSPSCDSSSILPYNLNINQDIAMPPIPMNQEEPKIQTYNATEMVDDEDQVTDWRALDKFVASQLSQDEDASTKCDQSNLTRTI